MGVAFTGPLGCKQTPNVEPRLRDGTRSRARWGWFPGWGIVPWVGDGGVGLTTEQVGGRMLFQQDCSPTDMCSPPMPGTELGAEHGAELEPLRALGCHQAWSTSRGGSQDREMALPEKGPERG